MMRLGSVNDTTFDECIIGTATRCGMDVVLVYDVEKIIDILIQQGMSDEEAWEYYGFNIEGAYVGEKTPLFFYGKEMNDQVIV